MISKLRVLARLEAGRRLGSQQVERREVYGVAGVINLHRPRRVEGRARTRQRIICLLWRFNRFHYAHRGVLLRARIVHGGAHIHIFEILVEYLRELIVIIQRQSTAGLLRELLAAAIG